MWHNPLHNLVNFWLPAQRIWKETSQQITKRIIHSQWHIYINTNRRVPYVVALFAWVCLWSETQYYQISLLLKVILHFHDTLLSVKVPCILISNSFICTPSLNMLIFSHSLLPLPFFVHLLMPNQMDIHHY